MSAFAAEWGDGWTVVVSGMPEAAVEIGQGGTLKEAFANLEDTPIQSVVRSPEATALRWARNQWGHDQVPPWSDFEPVDDPRDDPAEEDEEDEDEEDEDEDES